MSQRIVHHEDSDIRFRVRIRPCTNVFGQERFRPIMQSSWSGFSWRDRVTGKKFKTETEANKRGSKWLDNADRVNAGFFVGTTTEGAP